jgi:hypothetical protein
MQLPKEKEQKTLIAIILHRKLNIEPDDPR